MRGVGYATTEILLLILLAAAIGFLIGWILRRFLYNVDLGEYEARVKSAQAAHLSAEAQLAASQEQYEAATADLGSVQSKLAEADARATALNADLDAARVSAGGKDSRIEQLESEVAGLGSEVASLTDAADVATGRVEALERELSGTRANLDAALANAAEKEAAIAKLEADIAGMSALREESDARAARISELEVLVVEKASPDEREVATLQEALDAAKLELSRCADRVAERDARIAALEAGEVPIAAVAADDGDPPSKADAVAAMAEIATRTAGDEPVADDDLKKIHGVGPKLEKLLKSMGITSFRQVARFEAADIAVVTAALDAFPGRIERDDWMSSAAEEHRKKYGLRST